MSSSSLPDTVAPQVRERLELMSKTLASSGPGGAKSKNAKRKMKQAQEEAHRLKALSAMNVPTFRPVTETARRAIPADWRRPGMNWLILARVNSIPSEFFARMVIWMRANVGGAMGYVATEDDIRAAKGINLVDLIPRIGLMPVAVCSTKDEAEATIRKVGDFLEVSVQAVPFYHYSPVPSYTTNNIVYGQVSPPRGLADLLASHAARTGRDEEVYERGRRGEGTWDTDI